MWKIFLIYILPAFLDIMCSQKALQNPNNRELAGQHMILRKIGTTSLAIGLDQTAFKNHKNVRTGLRISWVSVNTGLAFNAVLHF